MGPLVRRGSLKEALTSENTDEQLLSFIIVRGLDADIDVYYGLREQPPQMDFETSDRDSLTQWKVSAGSNVRPNDCLRGVHPTHMVLWSKISAL